MKRLLTVLGLAALVGIVGAIEVAYWYPKSVSAIQMRERNIEWIRTQVNSGVTARDTIAAIRSAGFVAAATAQPVDTTEWIPLWQDISPPNGAWLAADSITCVLAVVSDPALATAAGITTVADTIQVTIQASMEGANPVAVTTTQGLTATQLETSSNNAVYKVVSIGRAWANNGTAPTNLQLLPYRFIRFIVTGDHVGAYRAIWSTPGPDRYIPGTTGR